MVRENKIYVSGCKNQGEKQLILFCLDMNGNVIWQKEYGDPAQGEVGSTLAFSSDSTIIISGTRRPNITGMPRQIAYLVKTDIDGAILDEHTYDFQNDQSVAVTNIETTDGQTVFSYLACPESCFLEFSGGVAAVNTVGTLVWNLPLPFSYEPDRPHIIQTDAITLVTNWHTKTVLPVHDLNPPALFYLNKDGQIQDSLVFENQTLKSIDDLEPVWEKGLVGCGSNYFDYIAVPSPELGGWVFKVNKNKVLLWERTYTDTAYQGRTGKFQSIALASDGGYIAVGHIVNNMTGVLEAHNWILKLDSLGCLQPGCGEINYISETEEATFLKGRDILVYPNPANSFVNIQLPSENTFKKLSAFLVSNKGSTIKQFLIDSNEIQINISDIETGVYYLMINQGNEIITSKRIIISR